MSCALHCIIRKTHVSTDELIIMFKEGRTVPRKGHTQKRDVLADPLYNNKVVTKLINNIMLDGKKGIAQKIVYGAFERVADKTLSLIHIYQRLQLFEWDALGVEFLKAAIELGVVFGLPFQLFQ